LLADAEVVERDLVAWFWRVEGWDSRGRRGGKTGEEGSFFLRATPRAAIVVASSLSLFSSLFFFFFFFLTRLSARRDSARATWRSMLTKKRVNGREKERETRSKHFLLFFSFFFSRV